MYNGIGLGTARGSGTNGYVQSNLSNLTFSRNRVEYNAEEDIRKAEAELNRKPNLELLEYQRRRQIELKCAEFEDLMEDKGFTTEEIETKVNEYRKLLMSQVESGELNLDTEMDLKNTHVRQQAQVLKKARMRNALKISEDFVDGSSFADKKEKDKKKDEPVPVEVKKEVKEETDSSSSSSDSSDSDSDSESSSSSESEDERARRKRKEKLRQKKAVIKKEIKEESADDKSPEPKRRRRERESSPDRRERRRRDSKSPERRRRTSSSPERRRRDCGSRSPVRRRDREASPDRRERRRRHSKSPERRRRTSSSPERRRRGSKSPERRRHRSPAVQVKEEPLSSSGEDSPNVKVRSTVTVVKK